MKTKSKYIILFILILFCIFSYFNSFEKLESNLRDSLLQSENKVDTRIKIISVDDESLLKLGRWPWPRKYYADLINILSKGNPAVIGIDIILSDKTDNPQDDKLLAEAITDSGKVVIPVYGRFKKYTNDDELRAIELTEPLGIFKNKAFIGHINTIADNSEGIDVGVNSDGIVRKGLLSFKYNDTDIKSFAWQLFNLYTQHTTKSAPELNIPTDKWNRFYIDFTSGPGTYENISFYSILNGDIPPEYFEDSIVLVGPYTVGIAQDVYYTPLDHQEPMYGVEVHANIIQSFLYNNFKQDILPIINILILLIICTLIYIIFNKLSPGKTALIIMGFIILYMVLSKLLYKYGYIISIVYPIALVIIVYLVMLVYQYIEELLEKKRITDVFGKYVAPQIVDQILVKGEEGLKLGGTRREITALFVDIRGFTPMSEKCQPEEVVNILNDYLHLTASSIFKYGGTLDKFIGDATMAIFNAPLDLEDHAFKAVQTAWTMKQGSEPLKKKLEEKFGRSVQFGIGVNTGYAVVGNIGAKFRMDYTAIGDTVNTAARLESNAKPGQILLSSSTYELVKDRIKATSLGGIKVKGKEQEIEIYQLEGILE